MEYTRARRRARWEDEGRSRDIEGEMEKERGAEGKEEGERGRECGKALGPETNCRTVLAVGRTHVRPKLGYI